MSIAGKGKGDMAAAGVFAGLLESGVRGKGFFFRLQDGDGDGFGIFADDNFEAVVHRAGIGPPGNSIVSDFHRAFAHGEFTVNQLLAPAVLTQSGGDELGAGVRFSIRRSRHNAGNYSRFFPFSRKFSATLLRKNGQNPPLSPFPANFHRPYFLSPAAESHSTSRPTVRNVRDSGISPPLTGDWQRCDSQWQIDICIGEFSAIYAEN